MNHAGSGLRPCSTNCPSWTRRCAARLAQIAREDAALASELRHLLAVDERNGVLDAGVVRVAATVMSQLASSAADGAGAEAVGGRRFGHYILTRHLGTGGMGEVWRAERVGDFEQAVAIKLIRPLLDSPDAARALRARAADPARWIIPASRACSTAA